MGEEFEIRSALAADYPFMEQMLLQAFDWTGNQQATLEQVRHRVDIAHYLTGWPQGSDFGVIAVTSAGDSVGATWARKLSASDRGYGFVAAEIPELTIGVHPAYRGRGVGRALMRGLIDRARSENIPALSLSVEDGNQARRLYERLGFRVVGRNGDSDTMLLDLP
ncbi:MAG: GCN5-related protein N-acetyltransferase [Pseudonocardiales bacterium]|nr:GCN5-related protein N-acetyltransferase [Pseudonocardiales bacterium]